MSSNNIEVVSYGYPVSKWELGCEITHDQTAPKNLPYINIKTIIAMVMDWELTTLSPWEKCLHREIWCGY